MSRRGFIAAAAAAVASGCGYSLQGRGITTDPSIKRIGVPLFKDQTARLGLDARVTAAVMEELLRRGRFTVVKDASDVDALVLGELVSYSSTPVNYSPTPDTTGTTQASRYVTTLVANVVYRKTGESEPIWSNDSFTQRDEYDVGDQQTGYFNREEQSYERLAKGFARNLVAAMLEAF